MSSTSRITPIHGGAVAAILKLLDSQKLMTLAVNRAEAADLPRIAEGLMGLIALMLLLYLVAPSAQQIVNLARLRAGGKP